MEKLEKHIADAIFEDYSIPAHYPTVKRTAGYAKNLAIEFKDWCDLNEEQQDELSGRELSDAELWNIFLSQKQF